MYINKLTGETFNNRKEIKEILGRPLFKRLRRLGQIILINNWNINHGYTWITGKSLNKLESTAH